MRDNVVIALDSTGIKVAKRGEWMRHKLACTQGLPEDTRCSRYQEKEGCLNGGYKIYTTARCSKELVRGPSAYNDISRVLANGTVRQQGELLVSVLPGLRRIPGEEELIRQVKMLLSKETGCIAAGCLNLGDGNEHQL